VPLCTDVHTPAVVAAAGRCCYHSLGSAKIQGPAAVVVVVEDDAVACGCAVTSTPRIETEAVRTSQFVVDVDVDVAAVATALCRRMTMGTRVEGIHVDPLQSLHLAAVVDACSLFFRCFASLTTKMRKPKAVTFANKPRVLTGKETTKLFSFIVANQQTKDS
jgi:hypothetical protein